MALGSRIQQRLDELDWKQTDLVEAAAKLGYTITPQSISNLINRDSKRSEQDEAIAHTLGVPVLWLVYGIEAHTNSATKPASNVTALEVSEPPKLYGLIGDLVEIAKHMSDRGLTELIGQARLLASMHPRPKANQVN